MALKAYCRSFGLPIRLMDVIFAHTTIHAILIKINSEKVVVIQGKHRICFTITPTKSLFSGKIAV